MTKNAVLVHYCHSAIHVVLFVAVTNIDLVTYSAHQRMSVEVRGKLASLIRSKVQRLGSYRVDELICTILAARTKL